MRAVLCSRVGCSVSLGGFPPRLLPCAMISLSLTHKSAHKHPFPSLWMNGNGLRGRMEQDRNSSCVWDVSGVVCSACSPKDFSPRFPLAISQQREFPLPLPKIQLGLLQGTCRPAVITVSPHVHQLLWSSHGAILPSTCLGHQGCAGLISRGGGDPADLSRLLHCSCDIPCPGGIFLALTSCIFNRLGFGLSSCGILGAQRAASSSEMWLGGESGPQGRGLCREAEPVSPVTGRVLIFTENTSAPQGIFWLCRCGHRVILAKEG